MINRNSHWSNKDGKVNNDPFLLKPVGKDYLWGGRRLNDDFAKDIDLQPLAETWECSTHEDGLSVVSCGEFADKSLKEVLELHPEYVGSHPKADRDIPILENLSLRSRIYLFRFILMVNMPADLKMVNLEKLRCGIYLMLKKRQK